MFKVSVFTKSCTIYFKIESGIVITRSNINDEITCGIAITTAESNSELTKTPHVSCSRYNGTALNQTLSCFFCLTNHSAYLCLCLYIGILVRYRYNTGQYIVIILHTVMQWQQRNIDHTLNSQKTPHHSSPSWASYGVAVAFWNKLTPL